MILEEIHENNPFLTVALCEFNAKTKNWCKADVTSLEGSMIDTIASNYGLNQFIQEPTPYLIVFWHQPNFHSGTKFSHGMWDSFIFALKL